MSLNTLKGGEDNEKPADDELMRELGVLLVLAYWPESELLLD